jgi:hypothetical protein
MAFNAQARKDKLIRAYVDAHGCASISVRDVAGNCVVSVSAAHDWKAQAVAVWWHADADKLRAIAAGIPKALALDDVLRLVEVGGERNHLRMTPHDVMLARASTAIDLINRRLRDMQRRGDLKSINTEYQDFRLRMKETGRNAPPYQAWLEVKKLEMVKAVAMTASGKRPEPELRKIAR